MTHLLEGQDRIELWKAAGRRLRMGAPNSLAVGDLDRVRQFIRMGSSEEKQSWLRYVIASHENVLSMYTEWILTWPEALNRFLPHADVSKAVREAVSRWTQAQKPAGGDPVFKLLSNFFSESVLVPEAASAYRHYSSAGQAFPMLEAMLQQPRTIIEDVQSALRQGNNENASAEFERYWNEVRLRHDHLAELVWAFGGSVTSLFDQSIAEEAHRESFSTTTFFDGFWAPVGKLAPEDLAAVLADYLRGHFSGVGRSGTVEIVEEDDRYRIILQPCGSGGAMRRRSGSREGLELGSYPDASPQTWSKKNVPMYCTHCALHEVLSVERFGYPAWVTEFDPNPNKPCGWTVFKSPDEIPESYFERLGVKKDPSKFVRPPV